MADYLIGIDYGTGGAKIAIIDTVGKVQGYAFREFPLIIQRPGWAEHDPHIYWESTIQLVQEAVSKSQVDPNEIRAISMSSAMPALVMVDQQYNPIGMAYILLDRRATEEVQWFDHRFGSDRIFQICGNKLEDHPVIINLLWEKNHHPDLYRQVYKALSIDSYVRLRMTGRAIANYSVLSLYGCYDTIRHRYDEELLCEMGIDPSLMPEACPCGEIIGELSPTAARDLGLPPHIPVTSGQLDCNAGWVGGGAISEGDIQMNLGTVGNFGIIHKDTHFLPTMLCAPYTIDSANTFVTVPTTLTGGQSIRYLRDNLSKMEIEMERLGGVDAYDLLNLEAEKVPPGSDGLVILPYLMGERSPIWDAQARGVIFGLSLTHTKGHITRAMMEAVAYALYHNFLLVKEVRTKLNYPIICNEGGARSVLWRRIITDVFNVPTALVKRRIGAPYGDAILSGVAVGLFPDFGIARQWAEYIEPMEPDPSNHARYLEYFDIYRNLYEHVKQDFQDLARVRNKYAG